MGPHHTLNASERRARVSRTHQQCAHAQQVPHPPAAWSQRSTRDIPLTFERQGLHPFHTRAGVFMCPSERRKMGSKAQEVTKSEQRGYFCTSARIVKQNRLLEGRPAAPCSLTIPSHTHLPTHGLKPPLLPRHGAACKHRDSDVFYTKTEVEIACPLSPKHLWLHADVLQDVCPPALGTLFLLCAPQSSLTQGCLGLTVLPEGPQTSGHDGKKK